MGKYCEICNKGTMTGHKVSHSERKSSRKWAPNVQRIRIEINGATKRMNVCTSCMRSGAVKRALPRTKATAVTE